MRRTSRQRVRLQFTGKSAHEFDVTIADPAVARVVHACQHLPGQLLFEYEDDDGAVRPITLDRRQRLPPGPFVRLGDGQDVPHVGRVRARGHAAVVGRAAGVASASAAGRSTTQCARWPTTWATR